MASFRYINKRNWGEIEKGYFFQAAMYYFSDAGQPLDFLVENPDGTFSIESKNGDFSPAISPNGRKRATEQIVKMTFKPRQVIILSNDIINKRTDFEFVQVAPVYGIKSYEKQQPWYNRIINDKLAGSVFINKNNQELQISVGQICTIHKTMLLQKQTKVDTDRMEFIESQILNQLDIK